MKTATTILLLSVYILFATAVKGDGNQTQLILDLDAANQQLIEDKMQGKTTILTGILSEHAVFMPEYQSTLNGKQEILAHYTTLYERQDVISYDYTRRELFEIQNVILEIGDFRQRLKWKIGTEEPVEYEGKYWRVWTKQNDRLLLRTEAFGFYASIEHPEYWVTDAASKNTLAPSGFHPRDTSVELKAYHALGQRGVKEKDGELRASLYAEDAIYYPFADKPKKGIGVLLPYLKEYSSHGAIIDSVHTHTHDVLFLDEYILEYTKFGVAWRYDSLADNASGKGIRLRKRNRQGELKIFRQIGMHNYH